MITVRLPLILSSQGHFERCNEISLNDIFEVSSRLLNDFKLKDSDFYLIKCSESVYQVKLRLLGGKGGFGSQLRAQGNKMSSKKRAGNYESCRSLNGQRLRVQKHTKMIEEYLAKEPERLSKREQEIREKMQKYLEAPDKKVMFSDPEYLKLCRNLIDSTEDAVRSGLRVRSQNYDSETESEESDSEAGSESEENGTVDREGDSESNNEIDNCCDKYEDSKNKLESDDEKAPIRNHSVDTSVNSKMYKNNSKCIDKYLSMK